MISISDFALRNLHSEVCTEVELSRHVADLHPVNHQSLICNLQSSITHLLTDSPRIVPPVTPPVTGRANPRVIGGFTPGTNPGITQGLNPRANPGLTEGLTPGLTRRANPGMTRGMTPGAIPSVTPGTTLPMTPGAAYWLGACHRARVSNGGATRSVAGRGVRRCLWTDCPLESRVPGDFRFSLLCAVCRKPSAVCACGLRHSAIPWREALGVRRNAFPRLSLAVCRQP